MHLRSFEICALKYMNLIARVFFQRLIGTTSSFKKPKVKSDLSTDMNMLLMIEEHIRRAICHSTY